MTPKEKLELARRLQQKLENEAYRLLGKNPPPKNRRDAIQMVAKTVAKGRYLVQVFQTEKRNVSWVTSLAKDLLEQPIIGWLEEYLSDGEVADLEAGRGEFGKLAEDPALLRAIDNEIRRLSGTHLRLVKAVAWRVAARYVEQM